MTDKGDPCPCQKWPALVLDARSRSHWQREGCGKREPRQREPSSACSQARQAEVAPLHTPLPSPSRSPPAPRGQPRHRTSVLSSRSLWSTLQPPKPRCCPRRPLAVHSRTLRRRPSPEASTGSAVKIPPQRAGAMQKNVPAAAGSACQMGELGRYGAHLLTVPVLSSGRTRLGESS